MALKKKKNYGYGYDSYFTAFLKNYLLNIACIFLVVQYFISGQAGPKMNHICDYVLKLTFKAHTFIF